MIFVSLGTQIYQFDRLVKELDVCVEKGIIKDDIFAQIGACTYLPKNYKYERFISKDDFDKYQSQADLIITHGGTGAIISALKKEKNVVAIPRLSQFGEHVDDHQIQVVDVLEKQNYLRAVYKIDTLGQVVNEAIIMPIKNKYQRESNIIQILTDYINSI